MRIYNLTKSFPPEERFSLTDQVRRSSRSICSNLSEGWHKRRYPAMFLSKLSDSIQEASETETWLEFAMACKYITETAYEELVERYEHMIAQLLTMQRKSQTFCKPKDYKPR